MEYFNIRVYGVLINEAREILLSDETYKGLSFTKFPGGGLWVGESLPDGLIREFKEECNLDITIHRLLHVTNTMVASVFDNSQVIAVYYEVKSVGHDLSNFRMENVDEENQSTQSFRWRALANLSVGDLSFDMDQQAWEQMMDSVI